MFAAGFAKIAIDASSWVRAGNKRLSTIQSIQKKYPKGRGGGFTKGYNAQLKAKISEVKKAISDIKSNTDVKNPTASQAKKLISSRKKKNRDFSMRSRGQYGSGTGTYSEFKETIEQHKSNNKPAKNRIQKILGR